MVSQSPKEVLRLRWQALVPKFSKSPKATIAISKQIISVSFMLAGQEAQVQEKMGYSWHVFDRRGFDRGKKWAASDPVSRSPPILCQIR